MTFISAQVSLYPLGCVDLAPAIEVVIEALRVRGLACEVGPMSTVTWGEDAVVFDALREGYAKAAALGPAVLQVAISNACPVPARDEPT